MGPLKGSKVRKQKESSLHKKTFLCRDRYSGEKVPTLQEAVEECVRHQLTIFFDVKDEPDKVLNIKKTHLN